jgi:hypothetical protein
MAKSRIHEVYLSTWMLVLSKEFLMHVLPRGVTSFHAISMEVKAQTSNSRIHSIWTWRRTMLPFATRSNNCQGFRQTIELHLLNITSGTLIKQIKRQYLQFWKSILCRWYVNRLQTGQIINLKPLASSSGSIGMTALIWITLILINRFHINRLAHHQKLPHCPSGKSKGKKNPENGARYQQHKHQELGSESFKSHQKIQF